MVEIVPIASGSTGNAIILRDGGRSLMLDCGLPWPEIQRATGYQAATVDAILLSHEHADHARGVLKAAQLGVPIFATVATLAGAKLTGHHHARQLDLMQVTALPGGWKVVAVPASHDGLEGAAAFLIGTPSGSTVAYIVDTAYVHHRFAGVTHWLVEANYDRELLKQSGLDPAQERHIVAGHMSIQGAIELLRANDLTSTREIWLLHLSDRHSDEAGFRRRVMAATGVPVYVARSLRQAMAAANQPTSDNVACNLAGGNRA